MAGAEIGELFRILVVCDFPEPQFYIQLVYEALFLLNSN